MSRRVKLPGADELFRPTGTRDDGAQLAQGSPADAVEAVQVDESAGGKAGPSGRVRHDEKITVYVTSGELINLEQTRLALRREHGLAVDRGRIVREAISLALHSVEADGEASPLVRRLRET